MHKSNIFTVGFAFIFLLLNGFVPNQSWAKDDFLQGEIFVRVLPQTAIKLPNIQSEKELKKLAQLPDLYEIITKYGVYDIRRTFVTNDELVNTIYTFKFTQTESVENLIKELSRLSFIDYAEKCPVYQFDFTPNDYNASQQWHIGKIDLLNAWNITQGNPNIRIAIIDDAFKLDHPDLQNAWATNAGEIANNGIDDDNNGFIDDVTGWDISMNDNNPAADPALINCLDQDFKYCHGTGVAGCAGARTNNGVGATAPAFNCKLIPIKAKNDNVSQTGITHGYQGIDYAIAIKANVINMSWGGTVQSATGNNIIAAAHNAGIVMCAAAGNTGTNTPHYPGSAKYVISVAATATNDTKASFSTYNDSVDVGAPGVNIYTCNVFGGYGGMDGTSEASPVTAGVCALMLSVNPCLTPDQLEMYLKQACDPYAGTTNTQYPGLVGAGRINAYKALQNLVINTSPVANFSFSESCNGKVQYNYLPSALNACATAYSWAFPGGNPSSSTSSNPLVTYSTTGNYTATLYVSNSVGSNQNVQTVNVIYNPTPVVNAGSDVSGCFNTSVQLNASVNLPNCTYTWTPTTGLSNPLILNPVLTFSGSPSSYTLKAYSAAGCMGSDAIYADIFPTPTTYAGLDQTINAGDSVQMLAQGAVTYSWTPTTGLSNPLIANPKASPSVTTTYTVYGFSADGCPKTDAVKITVNGTIGINEQFNQFATVYPVRPNPIENEAFLSAYFKEKGNLTVEVYDMMGRKITCIFEGNVNKGDFSLQWTQNQPLSSGFYWVKWTINQANYLQKVVVK